MTLFGNYSSYKANIRREGHGPKEMFNDVWCEDDFIKASFSIYGVDSEELDTRVASKPVKRFKAYLENWEVAMMKKNDPVAHPSGTAIFQSGLQNFVGPDCIISAVLTHNFHQPRCQL